MRWIQGDMWRASIILAGLLILFLLMILIPLSASAHGRTTDITIAGTAQPTVDLTVTALAKEQLALQIRQLQNQLEDQDNWFANNSTALIKAVATVIVALFGILQWAITVRQAQDKELKDREDERRKEIAAQDKESKDQQIAQDKDLRAQAEERFKTAVTALGDEKEGTQVGGAILLRSFLNPNDKEIYGRYYTQIFDLAVAYLRFSSGSHPPEDPDELPPTPEDSATPPPLPPLHLVLVTLFKEAFPLARKEFEKTNAQFNPQQLDATNVRLDYANLAGADLVQAWLVRASLRLTVLYQANLQKANLTEASLERAHLLQAHLEGADLSFAHFEEANLTAAHLEKVQLFHAHLEDAQLFGTHLEGANLGYSQLKMANFAHANLSNAIVHGANIEDARTLSHANLCGVQGLTKEQLLVCKAKGAIIDEDTTASPPQSPASPPQSNGTQASSMPSTQATPPTNTDGSSSTAAQPSTEP